MNDKKSFLLPEDHILLEELKDIGPLSTGTPLEEQKRKMMMVQTEATLRSRKTMIDLDKSNKRFSLVVGSFALLQVIIAIFQFGFDVLTAPNKWVGSSAAIIFFLFIFYMIKKMDKEIGE